MTSNNDLHIRIAALEQRVTNLEQLLIELIEAIKDHQHGQEASGRPDAARHGAQDKAT